MSVTVRPTRVRHWPRTRLAAGAIRTAEQIAASALGTCKRAAVFGLSENAPVHLGWREPVEPQQG